jgi:pyruvate/2-oxoacid:ferredoxin oxidoreductase beta subunit
VGDETLLNVGRPPMFCPGCSHDTVVRALDTTLVNMGLKGHEICIVSDIGCSGFFDVFFNTHAFHGLHGRALTYAAGIKLCRPDVTVVVTMGDGGVGIGGAHLLAACRRNLDLTLLVLNNFNFGMTGGQCSATTPSDAVVSSGFLNRLEKPLDICALALSAGAGFVCRCSAYQADLEGILEEAIGFKGFSVVDIQGLCPGRYTKLNKITRKTIAQRIAAQEVLCGPVSSNRRAEFGDAYRQEAASLGPVARPIAVEALFSPPEPARREVVILGNAGQHVITAGEVLSLAALTAGMHVSRKSEYDVTVLRGPSITEVIVSPEPIDYHGSAAPTVVVALAEEGVNNRTDLLKHLPRTTLVLQAAGIEIPRTPAEVRRVDFRSLGLKRSDWALGSLCLLAGLNKVISHQMLGAGLEIRFKGKIPTSIQELFQGGRR